MAAQRSVLTQALDRMKTSDATQVCTGCGESKPMNRQFFGSSKSGGSRRRCRKCEAASTRAHDLANPVQATERAERRRERLAAAGPGISQHVLARLRMLQGDRCGYCEQGLDGGGHVDHINPLAKAGTNAIENLALACFACNTEKHSKSLDEYFMWCIKVGKPLRGYVFERWLSEPAV